MGLSNNYKDIYEIILKDKINFQNQNLKITLSYFLKSTVEWVNSDKSNINFFL